jgi:hypothetical protein
MIDRKIANILAFNFTWFCSRVSVSSGNARAFFHP